MNSPLILKSSLLTQNQVLHGFTTRLGGFSQGPFASLNLAYGQGDTAAAVTKNITRLAQLAGFSPHSLCQSIQVHGNRILYLSRYERRKREADGMITQKPLVLGVRSADCVPILLWSPKGAAGALHAGWRGTIQQIASCGVQAFAQLGADPKDLVVAIGPAIGPCCFQVGPEVTAQFAALVPESLSTTISGQPSIDLWKANQVLLQRAGVLPEKIDMLSLCTSCHPELFFSYRRDFQTQGKPGQQMSFIQGNKS